MPRPHLACLVLALVTALLGCARTPGGAGQPGRPVQLGPGQLSRVAAMLGRDDALPAGCTLGEVTYDRRDVDATYRCAGTAVTLHLRADTDAREAPVRTRRFVLTPGAGMPPPLLDALLARIRTREDAFMWEFVPDAVPPAPATPPRPTVEGPRPATQNRPRAQAQSRPPTLDDNATRAGHFVWLQRPPPTPWEEGPQPAVAPASVALHRLAHEPMVPLALALAFVIAVLARQLRGEGRSMTAALAAVTLGGVALRLALAEPAPMNAFAFTRVLPLAQALYEGPALAWVAAATGRTIYLTDVIGWTNFALSAVTPLVFFAHARYLLRDAGSALAAAALVALLPMHIRFARSDVQFVTSLVTSSFTFLVLYGALTERSPRWRALCFALLPLLSLATYLTRPENIIFAALDLAALGLYLRADVPRRRLALAGALIAGTAAWSVANHLLVRYAGNVSTGLSAQTLRTALEIATDPELNTLVNPTMTPPLVPLLAVLGAATLARRGERGRAAFLVAWLAVFFVVHSFVRPRAPAMQARYHLHLVTPLVLLAAASVPWWRERRAALRLLPAAWMLLAPLLHQRFIRDTDYTEMHEARFLRAVRDGIGRCTVLEYRGPGVASPRAAAEGNNATVPSRVARMTEGLRGAGRESADVVPLQPSSLPSADTPCAFCYEGAASAAATPGTTSCADLASRVRLETVARARFRWHWYDDAVAGRIVLQDDGMTHVEPLLPEGTPVTVTLYRIRALAP